MNIPDTIISAMRQWHEEADIIGLGEAHHVPAIMECYSQLMMSNCFPQCRHIVVEFGVQKHQGLLDRYLSGESITLDELAPVWRDSPLQALWVYDCYRMFFHTIREINLTRPPYQHLHVWLAEPCPSDSISDKSELSSFAHGTSASGTGQSLSIRQAMRTHAFVSLIEQLMAQQQGKIVLIFGMRHLARTPVNGRTTLVHELLRPGRSIRVLWPEMPPRFYLKPLPIHQLEWIPLREGIGGKKVAPWGGPPTCIRELCDAVIRVPGSYRASMCDHSLSDPPGNSGPIPFCT